MRLAVFQHLDNNSTKLEYANAPAKPKTAPAYIMPQQKADEFVKKYNKQSNRLENLTIFLIVMGSVISLVKSAKDKAKILPAILKSLIAGSAGLVAGCIIANHEKSKLMKKYHVEEI